MDTVKPGYTMAKNLSTFSYGQTLGAVLSCAVSVDSVAVQTILSVQIMLSAT